MHRFILSKINKLITGVKLLSVLLVMLVLLVLLVLLVYGVIILSYE